MPSRLILVRPSTRYTTPASFLPYMNKEQHHNAWQYLLLYLTNTPSHHVWDHITLSTYTCTAASSKEPQNHQYSSL
eukprot:6647855-Prorocentrum_lima.AAC.1